MTTCIRRALAAASILAGVAGISSQAVACGAEPFISEICYFSGTYCPTDYLEANGQQVSSKAYPALFALIGTKFGGSGTTIFNLPDLRGRALVDANPNSQGGGVPISYAQALGVTSAKLGLTNLPTGNLPVAINGLTFAATTTVNVAGQGTNPPAANVIYGSASFQAAGTATSIALGGGSTVVASTNTANFALSTGGQSFSTQVPTLGVLACIAVNGYFPEHP